MRGWLGTLIALPMSWHSEATTTSSSAPARSASVAVCRQCVSWSVAKPSVIELRERSIPRTLSATRGWFCMVSAPMTAHCSAVDSSIRVKLLAWSFVTVMTPVCPLDRSSGERCQDFAGGEVAVVRGRPARHRPADGERRRHVDGDEQLAELARGREVLLLLGDADLFDAVAGPEAGDDRLHQL